MFEFHSHKQSIRQMPKKKMSERYFKERPKRVDFIENSVTVVFTVARLRILFVINECIFVITINLLLKLKAPKLKEKFLVYLSAYCT